MTNSIAKKSPTGSLPPAGPLAITPTFNPWRHTSDDSYIYQLSLVVATASVSFLIFSIFFVCGRLNAGNLGFVERELNLNINMHGRHVWFGDAVECG